MISLLRAQRGHLRGPNLSQMVIRGASLRGVEMQDTTLARATVRDTMFTEAFDDIWALAISRNGQYWAASGKRGEVRVWREAGQRLHLLWQAHTYTVMALAFSPDERMLATGSWDGAVKLWDLEQGTLLWTGWHSDSVDYVTFALAGRVVASGGNDAVIQLWDATSGTHRQTLTGHAGPVFALACSPDGRLLASGGFDGVIRLWDLSVEQQENSVRLLTGHTNWVSGLAFAPDGHTLASASWDRTVNMWDVRGEGSLSVRQTLTGHTDRVFRVAWSPNGQWLASGSLQQGVQVWDVTTGRCRWVGRTNAPDRIHRLAWSPDGTRLASCGDDGSVLLWDLASGERVRTLRRDRPYERLNISGVQGLSEAQRATLRALGSIEDHIRAS